jgi:hypothetical protein
MIFCDPYRESTAASETTPCPLAATIYRRSERKRFKSGRRIAGGRRRAAMNTALDVIGSCDIHRTNSANLHISGAAGMADSLREVARC